MTDQEIIQGLINRDEKITRDFFFRRCQPLIYSLIAKFYPKGADYDELVNELYLHLMEDNARRLRQYEGRSSIYQWLKSVSRNYFLDRKMREQVMESDSKESLTEGTPAPLIDNSADEALMDVAAILDQIENENYRMILQKHVIEEMSFDELEKITGIKKANLYNIKARAMKALEKIARIARAQGDVLCAVRCGCSLCGALRRVHSPWFRDPQMALRAPGPSPGQGLAHRERRLREGPGKHGEGVRAAG